MTWLRWVGRQARIAAVGWMVATLSLAQVSEAQGNNMTSSQQSRVKGLRAFAARTKFVPTDRYTGVRDPAQRHQFNERMNQLALELEPLASLSDPKPGLLRAFERAWPQFELADTEDREAALEYFEELMALLGVESSDGLLSRLAYGFDPKPSAPDRQQAALSVMTAEERGLVAQFEKLTAMNASAELRRLLGAPQIEQATAMAWVRTGDMKDLVSLTQMEGKWVLSWMLRGQLWGRTLPAS